MHIIGRAPITHIYPSDQVQTESATQISNQLIDELKKQPVLLLLSGGSAIKMYKELFKFIANKNPDLSNLTVSLFDERFVLPGSPDSNEQQLHVLGIIDLLERHHAKWISFLGKVNRSGLEVAQRVNNTFSEILKTGTTLFILAGIGEDSHTAGLLPTTNSLIIQEIFESENLIEYYELERTEINHFQQRVTATPQLIKQADHVLVYSVGARKKEGIVRFLKNKETIYECPSLILMKSKNEVVVFTDQEVKF